MSWRAWVTMLVLGSLQANATNVVGGDSACIKEILVASEGRRQGNLHFPVGTKLQFSCVSGSATALGPLMSAELVAPIRISKDDFSRGTIE